MRNVISTAVALILVTGQVLQAQNLLGTKRLSIAQELKIDGVTEDLVSIGWVAVRSDGTMALSQSQDKCVVIYDANGRRVAKFGRAGQGPGEFQALTNAGFRRDTLWVYDFMSRRTTLISPKGTLAGEITNVGMKPRASDIMRFPSTSSATPYAALTDGTWLVRISVNERNKVANFVADASYWFQIGADAEIRKFMGRSQDGTTWVSTSFGNGGSAGSRMPFLATPVDSASFDGQRRLMLNVENGGPNANTFALFVVNAQGDTIVRKRYPFQVVPLPRARLDSAWQAMGQMGTRPVPPEHAANIRAKRVDVSFLAPTYEAFLGLDYSIWIRLRVTDAGDPAWLVLDAAGNPVGHLRIPSSVRVKAATMQNLWATLADADGVQSVVRYRLEAIP